MHHAKTAHISLIYWSLSVELASKMNEICHFPPSYTTGKFLQHRSSRGFCILLTTEGVRKIFSYLSVVAHLVLPAVWGSCLPRLAIFFIILFCRTKYKFHCVNTSYLPDDSYSPAPAGPAKRKKKTSRVSPPAGPAHYNPLARWPSSCLTRQRDVTS